MMCKAKRFCIVVLVLVLLTTLFPSVDILVPSAEALTSSQQKKQDKAVKEYMSKIDSSMMPYEKAYILFNELNNTVGYDWDRENSNRHKAYGALVDKVAVCDGFSYAYEILLNKAGIKNIIVTGKLYGMGHAWNMIELYDKWYHVDVTNDMFLLTDSQLSTMSTWTKKKTTPKNSIYGKDAFFVNYNQTSKIVNLWFSSNEDKLAYYSIKENKTYTVTTKLEGSAFISDTFLLFKNKGEKSIKKRTYKTHKTTKVFSSSIQKFDKISSFYGGEAWEPDMLYIAYSLKGESYNCVYNTKTKQKFVYQWRTVPGDPLCTVGDYILFVESSIASANTSDSKKIHAVHIDTGEVKPPVTIKKSTSFFTIMHGRIRTASPNIAVYKGRAYFFEGKNVYRYIPATGKIKKIKTLNTVVYRVEIEKSGGTTYLRCIFESGKAKRIKLS